MAQVPAENSENGKLMTDLAEEWIAKQKKLNGLISLQDHDLRDKLVGGLMQLALNISVYNPPKPLLGRISDVLFMDPAADEQKKITFITKVIKNLANPTALDDLNTSRMASIEQGISLIPEVQNIGEWVDSRMNAKEPFAKDPGFVFHFHQDAIAYAVNGYLRNIEAGVLEMPHYENLCQQIISASKLAIAKSAQGRRDIADGKVDSSEVREMLPSDPDRSKPDRRRFDNDLGL
mgnify:CR=1 FL=1